MQTTQQKERHRDVYTSSTGPHWGSLEPMLEINIFYGLRVLWTLCFIRLCYTYFIRVLYKRAICVLYFLCFIFSKEQNQLITSEIKVEETFEPPQKNILKFWLLSRMHCSYPNGSLKNELKLTMKILISHTKPQHNWDLTKRNSRKITANSWREKDWFWPRIHLR